MKVWLIPQAPWSCGGCVQPLFYLQALSLLWAKTETGKGGEACEEILTNCPAYAGFEDMDLLSPAMTSVLSNAVTGQVASPLSAHGSPSRSPVLTLALGFVGKCLNVVEP